MTAELKEERETVESLRARLDATNGGGDSDDDADGKQHLVREYEQKLGIHSFPMR